MTFPGRKPINGSARQLTERRARPRRRGTREGGLIIENPASAPRAAVIRCADGALAEAIGGALETAGMIMEVSPSKDLASLDVAVIVAGDVGAAPFAETTAQTFSATLGGELRAVFLALKSGVGAIRARGTGGSVVIVAPPAAGHRSFDALRQGLRLLARSAALELAPEGIRVNTVLPGAGANPLGRPCAPADVAAAVAFVASDRAHFMTGADLPVDGGRLAQ